MKSFLKTSAIIFLFLSLISVIFNSCKKDKKTPPVITTTAISAITQTSAESGGNVTDEGGATVEAKGICWNAAQNPTISNNKTTDGSGIGNFSSSMTGLTPGTTYYVKAYATNSIGTGYGTQMSFETNPVLVPVLTTTAISNISQTSATGGGNITSDGGASVTSRGICWSTSQNPTTANSKTTDGNGSGMFTSSMTGLSPNTTYYVRGYATNSAGTGYGDQVYFTTNPILIPTLTTTPVNTITSNGAKSGGEVISDGGGNITVKGVCWNTSPNPTTTDSKTTDGSGLGTFSSSLAGLSANTTYYLRAYAVNSAGIGYGNEISFKTSPEGVGCENLLMTSGIYPETGNLISAIQGEFGSSYTIADWSDLKAITNIDAWISCMGLKEDQNFWILRYGNHIYSGNRHYFVTYSTNGVAGSFLVHEQIGNKLFLGSWYGFNFNIIARKIL